ncbi:MAG TPA: YggS family pyridoxal phosphate-dependent enzyme [Myxococcaceae bacterium]|nr:YggS family pyridoxal phosphate-dependent enzyme [Myxococcaceae bacterium]
MTEVAASWRAVLDRVEAAEARAGRRPGSVEVVAVSKLQPPEAIRAAYGAGARAFGENYAQELRDKAEALSDLPGLRWHAIGPLQTNKARYVARSAHVFHALDRLEVAQELSRRRTGAPLAVYVEVNVAGEGTKSGVAPAVLGSLLDAVRPLPGLHILGLMTMPPLAPADEVRPFFRALAALAREHGLPGLSMGSTHDFETAIEEGATAIRVGTAIFGERPRRGDQAPVRAP